jgi:hypothetical protein
LEQTTYAGWGKYFDIMPRVTSRHMIIILYLQEEMISGKNKNVMDPLPNEQNFDLDKSRQKFHHSLKEHHKISNISKFRCEML